CCNRSTHAGSLGRCANGRRRKLARQRHLLQVRLGEARPRILCGLDEISVKSRLGTPLGIAPTHRIYIYCPVTVHRDRTGANQRVSGARQHRRQGSTYAPNLRVMRWLEVVFSSRETLERKRREQRAEQRAVLVAPLQALLTNVFSVLFPSDCRLCSTPLNNLSRIPVCTECLEAIQPVRAPQCVICGDRLASAQLLVGDGRCHSCRDFEPEFARAMSFGEYEGGLRGLIHLLKYEAVLPVASVLGGMLSDTIQELLPACGDAV